MNNQGYAASNSPVLYGQLIFCSLLLMLLTACGGSLSGAVSSRQASMSDLRLPEALHEVSISDGGVAGMVIPGMVAAVHPKDRASSAVAYGFADREQQLPMPETGLFHIGSLTKTYTAALIMQLDQEKRLSLDDPISPAYVSFPNGENITIRMLLSHTSGITTFNDSKLGDKFAALLEQNDNPAPGEIMALVIRADSPDFAPGAKFHYSNSNYILLGMIAEKVTGNAWHKEVRSRFLEPLNLKNTYTYGREQGPEAVSGYTICADSSCSTFAVTKAGVGLDWKAAWAAGAIVSSAGDIAVWMKALVAGALLDREHQRAMQTVTPQSRAWAEALPKEQGMIKGLGLCLFLFSYPEAGDAWGHGGIINGYSSIGAYFTQAESGISLLTNLNQTDGTTALGRLVKAGALSQGR